MVENSKSDPEIFLKSSEELGGTIENTYVIKGSYNGIRATYAADMIPIMVPDMLEPDEELFEKAMYIKKALLMVKKYVSRIAMPCIANTILYYLLIIAHILTANVRI